MISYSFLYGLMQYLHRYLCNGDLWYGQFAAGVDLRPCQLGEWPNQLKSGTVEIFNLKNNP